MKAALAKLEAYCRKNQVEINIDPEGISLWATVGSSDFTIREPRVTPSQAKAKIDAVIAFRKAGWESN